MLPHVGGDGGRRFYFEREAPGCVQPLKTDHQNLSSPATAMRRKIFQHQRGGVAVRPDTLLSITRRVSRPVARCRSVAGVHSGQLELSRRQCQDKAGADGLHRPCSNGARGGGRTHNLQLRRLTLYPIELHARRDFQHTVSSGFAQM